jgi:hypothetical protein
MGAHCGGKVQWHRSRRGLSTTSHQTIPRDYAQQQPRLASLSSSLHMAFGDVTITLRPIKFAFVVNPVERGILDRVVRATLFQWGGLHNPIVPTYGRLPRYWSEPTRRLPSAEICKGYLRMFDPDAVIMCGSVDKSIVPQYVPHVHTLDEFAGDLSKEDAPTFSVGLFEVLMDFADEEFKYVRRDGMKLLALSAKPAEPSVGVCDGREALALCTVKSHRTGV